MKKMMKNRIVELLKSSLLFVLAFCIPALLAVDTIQSRRYAGLEKEVKNLDEKQKTLIESNKQLITEISVLSGSERIENLAVNELAMHRASSAEIVRIEVKGN